MLYDPKNPKSMFTGFGLNSSPAATNEPEGDELDEEDDDDLGKDPAAEEEITQNRLAFEHALSRDQLEDFWAHFSNLQTTINCCNVVVAIMFLIGVHQLLVAISLRLAEVHQPASFHLLYQPVIWWFLPGFGALCMPREITIRIWSLFTDHRTIRAFSESI